MDRCKCYLLLSHFPIKHALQTQYLATICNLKRHLKLYVLVCGCYHVQKIFNLNALVEVLGML